MSAFVLKWIAIASMAIDHIGAVFFPNLVWMRVIGRLAFPIFCFLLSEGFFYTKSKRRYALRLGLFAALSEIPFDLAFQETPLEFHHQNVFFTLLMGVAALWLLEHFRETKPLLGIALCTAAACVAELMNTDYGWFGVALVVFFYVLRHNQPLRMGAFLLLNTGKSLQISQLPSINVQIFAIGAAVPLICYNGKRGKHSLKYFFYLFYPLHLLALSVVRYALL